MTPVRMSLQEPERRLQRALERGPVWGQELPQPYRGRSRYARSTSFQFAVGSVRVAEPTGGRGLRDQRRTMDEVTIHVAFWDRGSSNTVDRIERGAPESSVLVCRRWTISRIGRTGSRKLRRTRPGVVGPIVGPEVGSVVRPSPRPAVRPVVRPVVGRFAGPAIPSTTGQVARPIAGPAVPRAIRAAAGPGTGGTIGRVARPVAGGAARSVAGPAVGPVVRPVVAPAIGQAIRSAVRPVVCRRHTGTRMCASDELRTAD